MRADIRRMQARRDVFTNGDTTWSSPEWISLLDRARRIISSCFIAGARHWWREQNNQGRANRPVLMMHAQYRILLISKLDSRRLVQVRSELRWELSIAFSPVAKYAAPHVSSIVDYAVFHNHSACRGIFIRERAVSPAISSRFTVISWRCVSLSSSEQQSRWCINVWTLIKLDRRNPSRRWASIHSLPGSTS